MSILREEGYRKIKKTSIFPKHKLIQHLEKDQELSKKLIKNSPYLTYNHGNYISCSSKTSGMENMVLSVQILYSPWTILSKHQNHKQLFKSKTTNANSSPHHYSIPNGYLYHDSFMKTPLKGWKISVIIVKTWGIGEVAKR